MALLSDPSAQCTDLHGNHLISHMGETGDKAEGKSER